MPTPRIWFGCKFGNGNRQAIIFESGLASFSSFFSSSCIYILIYVNKRLTSFESYEKVSNNRTICSTPKMTMYLYGETSNFHKSFWKKCVCLKTPLYKEEKREYCTSHVFSSTPSAFKPFFAAAKNNIRKSLAMETNSKARTSIVLPITTRPSPDPISRSLSFLLCFISCRILFNWLFVAGT